MDKVFEGKMVGQCFLTAAWAIVSMCIQWVIAVEAVVWSLVIFLVIHFSKPIAVYPIKAYLSVFYTLNHEVPHHCQETDMLP